MNPSIQEVEDSFVSSLGWACQETASGKKDWTRYISEAFKLEPDRLNHPAIKRIYVAIRSLWLGEDSFDWTLVRWKLSVDPQYEDLASVLADVMTSRFSSISSIPFYLRILESTLSN